MNWGPVLLCGWPGLPGLWYRGYATSLLVAIGFSILLNLALISSFLWPMSLGETFSIVAWPIIVLIWVTSAVITYRNLPDLMSVRRKNAQIDDNSGDTLFIAAQREYLGGNWEQAELMARKCINRTPRDIEARLLHATLLRHQRRLEESAQEIDTILKFDESVNWIFEIRREQKLIELIIEHEADESAGEYQDDDDVLPTNNDGFVNA